MQQSLRETGLSEAQIRQAVKAAIKERVDHGLLGGEAVPRAPKTIHNIKK